MSTRRRGATRREEILTATVELVGERGHQAVRVADVAKRLSVSAGLIIYHFGTKEELLAAAFAAEAERDIEVARTIIAGEASVVGGLFGLVRWYLPTGESSRSWRLWLDGWAASQFDPSLAGVVQGFDEAWRQLFREVLEGCRAAGSAQFDNLEDAAEQLTALLNGLAVRCLTAPVRPGEDELAGWARRYLVGQFGITDETIAG